MMEALINAGGKGRRMGPCGIEKPMQIVGGKPTIAHVVDAIQGCKKIKRILVSVSSHTPETKKYLEGRGVETIETSGEGFVDDLHEAFKVMRSSFILVSPSDLPLLKTRVIEGFIDFFDVRTMESAMAIVAEEVVRSVGITPSYAMERDGRQWVLSGLSIMDRSKTMDGMYLKEELFKTDWPDLAVNVNTQYELDIARNMFNQ